MLSAAGRTTPSRPRPIFSARIGSTRSRRSTS
uniref:Uncharacterized protein n=1 Tax=Rhizophora mucronata TaxID=61149 RepID=A0A2P2NMD9_RHIMU